MQQNSCSTHVLESRRHLSPHGANRPTLDGAVAAAEAVKASLSGKGAAREALDILKDGGKEHTRGTQTHATSMLPYMWSNQWKY